MIFSCLSVIRQGWLGIPLFFLGIVSLAFSQFAQTADNAQVSAQDLVASISAKLATQKKIMNDLNTQLGDEPMSPTKKEILSNLETASKQDENAITEVNRLKSNLKGVEDALSARRNELQKSIRETSSRLSDSQNILEDLKDNFAGRFSEAQPALQVLNEAVERTSSETEALSKLMESARNDAKFGMKSLVKESEDFMTRIAPTPPISQPVAPKTSVGRNVASVIQSREAMSLSSSDRFSPSINASPNILTKPLPVSTISGNGTQISKLETELAASKNLQTELSEDTAQMQIELRRAYRDIVSLKSNLDESQQMVQALERSKNALNSASVSSQGVSAKSISDQINRLERELDNARSDLRQSRQSLLMEQERSNSYIRSITTELERTRRELDLARSSAANAGVDSARLMTLERELSQTKNALRMAQSAPKEASARDFLDLQDELRKALGEIARMQVEVGEKKDLENQLLQLKSSLEDAGDSSSRSASPAYVNKLLLDLNAAKKEVLKAKEENRLERNSLAEKVQELEDKLKSSNLQLVETKKQFDETKKQMAKREFDFANTIQSLEEDAQVAQEALREASLGKLPAIPFVNEMEQNLEDSENRIQELSQRFDLEQSRASEVIDGLKVELDNAVLRQKRAMEQLSRRELELKGKDEELNLVLDEKQKLKEELEVVKVIAGQLQDLNQVLEETKDAQNKNNINTDEVVLSLRDELNKVKVELVFEREENERIQAGAALEIASLEEQLVETHNKLLSEQESLVNQTDESQDLVLDLKSELDKAREEIARMKTAGLGESVETRQAVSQLQEALGTIRILQESLDEAESYNAEVDNLKAELADAMTKQIETLQVNETEKEKLLANISDLEAELMIMREEGKGASLETKKMVAKLNDDLNLSQKEITALQKRLENSDDSSITAVVLIEEELLEANAVNADLRAQLESLQDEKTRTIDLLEKELATAVAKLDSFEEGNNNDIVDLRKANAELSSQLEQAESRNLADLAAIEDELADAIKQKEVAVTESQNLLTKLKALEGDTPQEYAEIIQNLENQLNEATAKLDELAEREPDTIRLPVDDLKVEDGSLVKQEAFAMLEGELANAIEDLDRANNQINSLLEDKKQLMEQLADNKFNSSSEDQIKIEFLESKLEESLQTLADLENNRKEKSTFGNEVSGEAIQKLETDLAKSEATISELQEKLSQEKQEREKLFNDFRKAGEQISRLEASRNEPLIQEESSSNDDLEAYKLLEEQLVSSQLEVEALRQQNEAEEQGRVALEQRLEKAILMIAQSEEKPSEGTSLISPEVADLKEEIKSKNLNLSDLKKQLDLAIEELALKESELEILQATKAQPTKDFTTDSEEITKLTQEIANLKDSLAKAKTNAAQSKPDPSEISSMQEQLQNAVADGLELQAELEETRKRMQGMEQQLASSNSGQYDQLIKQAKDAEQAAFAKIQGLTDALRKSEELRKETENLLLLAQEQKPSPSDITKDPRYQELEIEITSLKQELSNQPEVNPNQDLAKQEELKDLQEEMRLLQQDLLNARNLNDPMVADLQRKLELSREDAQKLNIEFKNAMEEFGKIKDQVTSLENENARLRDVSLNAAKNEADQQNKVLQNRINSLSNENSNLSVELGVKENRLTELREQLAQAQAGIPGLTADSAALKAQIIRLEGMLQAAQDNQNKSTFEVDAVKQQLAFTEERARGLDEQLRNAQSQLRNLPARIPNLSAPAPVAPVVGIPITPSAPSLPAEQLAELNNLRQENQRLQGQLVSLTNRPDPDRALLDQKIRDLNQRNMSAQVQLDQERAQVASLSKELADARNIKQEVLDRGRSAAMKVELLNDELANARNRVQSLEKALIGAREAIRVLRSGGNSSNTVQVSMPQNNSFSTPFTPVSRTPINRNQFAEGPVSPLSRFGQPQTPVTLPNSPSLASSVRNIPEGDASFSMKVEVQFLNNRNRPAGFTEFFLVGSDLDQILADAGIRLPANEGIGSYAEYWARSVQRGYRFPGAAASIRNALANESVLRIKTNSLGEANIENVKAGRYFLVGASTLGQVGVVWSKPIDISNGVNNVNLSLRDAAWAE
jgi:chromosome segregation ATPase